MRITRDTLLKLARQTVQQRMFNNLDIIAAYLTGSLLTEDPFLGSSTDIDLVFVHRSVPPASREIVCMSDDIHIDIFHRKKTDYEPPRELRVHPRLGFEIYAPELILETEHFFEFTQASVRAGFDDPENRLKRSYTYLNAARQRWMDLQFGGQEPGPKVVMKYLQAVEDAGNAVAVLNGPPLTERRFLLTLKERADALERPGLSAGLLGLIGGLELDASRIRTWFPEWESAYLVGGETHNYDLRIHAGRLNYYRQGCEIMLEEEFPQAAFWPLLYTWTLAVVNLPELDDHLRGWLSVVMEIGLMSTNFGEKLEGLDQYLDTIDEMLEEMTANHGLDPF